MRNKNKNRLLQEGWEYFSTANMYKAENDGDYISYFRYELKYADLRELAILVPNCNKNGDTVDQSNYRSFPKCRHAIKNGGDLYVRLTCNCPKVKEAIESLECYPILDEDDYNKLSYEREQEAWEDFGDRELAEIVANFLGVDEVETSYEIQQIVNAHENVMREDGDSFSLDERLCKRELESAGIEKVWACIEKAEMTKEDFEDLPHSVYHAMRKAEITDSETSEKLEVPSFILVQYSESQLPLGI